MRLWRATKTRITSTLKFLYIKFSGGFFINILPLRRQKTFRHLISAFVVICRRRTVTASKVLATCSSSLHNMRPAGLVCEAFTGTITSYLFISRFIRCKDSLNEHGLVNLYLLRAIFALSNSHQLSCKDKWNFQLLTLQIPHFKNAFRQNIFIAYSSTKNYFSAIFFSQFNEVKPATRFKRIKAFKACFNQ